MKKLDTAPAQGGIGSKTHWDYTPRERRLLQALARGPLHREEVDRVSGASNGPYVVGRLRSKGWTILCEMVAHTDRDGRAGTHGVYHLETTDQQRLRGILAQERVGVADA